MRPIKTTITIKNFRKYQPTIIYQTKSPSQTPTPPRNIKPNQPIIKHQPTITIKQPNKPPTITIKQPIQHQIKQPLKPIQPIKQPPKPIILPPTRNNQNKHKSVITQKTTQSRPITNKKIETIKELGTEKTLIIIAAGPSVKEINFLPIKEHPLIDIMCINKPYKPLWPTKYWAFCDHTQYKRNTDTWDSYNGIILNSTNVKARKPNQIIIQSKPGKGFSLDLTTGYHIGRSSTYAAMQIAHYLNYKQIYLFGVDMTKVGNSLWHYGANEDVTPENRMKRFAAEAENYQWAAQNLPPEIKTKYTFCSNYNPWEFTKHYPKLDHTTAIQHILNTTTQK